MDEAQQVLQHHARTFSAAAALLAPDTKDEIACLYRFCRVVDDLADESADAAALSRLAIELEGRAPPSALVQSLQPLARRGVPLGMVRELVRGVSSDLGQVRIPDEAALLRYAWQVAGTVGAMCCPLLGAPPEGQPFAVDLGLAMQLSNIARDVAEDAARDRVYLPASWLLEQGVHPDEIVEGRADEAVAAVVARVVELAEVYYRSADAGLRWLPWRPRLAVSLAARRYRAIGRTVVRRGTAALRDRTVLGPVARASLWAQAPWVALMHGLQGPRGHQHELHGPLR
jgi:phytoene synthase